PYLLASVLWASFGAWAVALEYRDYPVGNHGHRFRDQRRLLARQRPPAGEQTAAAGAGLWRRATNHDPDPWPEPAGHAHRRHRRHPTLDRAAAAVAGPAAPFLRHPAECPQPSRAQLAARAPAAAVALQNPAAGRIGRNVESVPFSPQKKNCI